MPSLGSSHSYSSLHHQPKDPSTTSTRNRNLLVALSASIFTFLVLSLSAHRNAPSSPSAQRAASYLPKLPSLSTSQSNTQLLAYRKYLEETTSPSSYTTHSPTLTFDHIYVLSLPNRTDRRNEMQKLANALGIEIEFVDASDKNEPFFQWIAERVGESRKLRKQIMSKARKVAQSTIGGLHIGSDWLTPYPSPNSTSLFPPYPPPSRSLQREFSLTHSSNWVQHLESLHSQSKHTSLKPQNRNLNITRHLWDPVEKVKVRQVTPGVMSTWWGQTRVMKRMIERGDKTALVLEDDVDFEWDLERLWAGIESKLPKDKDGKEGWDITYLGHCWGGENQKPQYLHPLLHPSTGPMCLHAYALSLAGANRIFSHLSSPWFAYTSAVDLALPTLMHFDEITSFSVVPPLVIQRKDGPSDLQKGNGSKWRGVLRDSTHERVMRDEGTWHEGWEDIWDPRRIDPATQLRCGPV